MNPTTKKITEIKRVGFKLINGQSIYCIDYSQLKDQELIDHVIYTCVDVLEVKPNTCFLIDVTGTKLTLESLNYIIDASKRIQSKVNKSAVIGVEGLMKSFLNTYLLLTGSKIMHLSSREEAEAYLTA